MIVIDESVDFYWLRLLKQKEFNVYPISQHHAGMPDVDIIEFIKKNNVLLITEDKDFGELVFAHGHREVAIILLRYDQPKYELIEDRFIHAVVDYYQSPSNCFITITKLKTRKRSL